MGRQHIVEIVRDTARQVADGLHLLRLPQLVLQASAFGDRFREVDHAADRVGTRIPGPNFPADPVGASVGTNDQLFVRAFCGTSETPLIDCSPPFRRLRKDVVMAPSDESVVGETIVREKSPAHGELLQLAVEHRDGRR